MRMRCASAAVEESRVSRGRYYDRLDFFGLIVGALAKLVMPGRDPGGVILTSLLGIVGAVLGGFLGRSLDWFCNNDSRSLITTWAATGIACGHIFLPTRSLKSDLSLEQL